MTNEIQTYEQAPALPSVYSDVNLYQQFFKIAEQLSKTDLVPATYKNKPENCLIAIDTARQIGAKNPLFVMQNLNIIKGKPSWSGQYCSALVYTNFKNVKINRVGNKEDGTLNGIFITAADKNGEKCRGSVVTLEMARREGWYDKEGSKWKTMPEQMMIYRAFTFFARAFCPDKLLGMHDEYEVQDMTPAENTKAQDLENKLNDVLDAEIVKD
jgi:hypothetical protein